MAKWKKKHKEKEKDNHLRNLHEEQIYSSLDVSHLQCRRPLAQNCHWKEHPTEEIQKGVSCVHYQQIWFNGQEMPMGDGFCTWGRVRSSLKKLKTVWGETGSQSEVAALRTTPFGWPGSVGLWTVTRTPTSFKPESVVHRCPFDALMLEQKLFIILCASFIMLLFPSGEGITEETKIQSTTLQTSEHCQSLHLKRNKNSSQIANISIVLEDIMLQRGLK